MIEHNLSKIIITDCQYFNEFKNTITTNQNKKETVINNNNNNDKHNNILQIKDDNDSKINIIK